MDDKAVLLRAVREMNAEALTKVFDLYAPAIYKYAFHYCHIATVADQIVGDVFARLIEQLSLGKGPSSNLRSYLFEIAYHAVVDDFRYYRTRRPLDAAEGFLPSANYTDRTAEEQILFKNVLRAIRNDLTEDQRHVLILRFLEGFSVKETALIMGKTVTNTKVIQNRALAALRQSLDDEELDYKDTLRAMALQPF
jgi:RNA polymerase sigma-70 factor, ECF subfamily